MKALIITPYINGDLAQIIGGERFDVVICADASYQTAESAGLSPDVIIGDFDHGKNTYDGGAEVVTVPCEKDDTDTMLCIKRAISLSADEILIAGGIGGRLDHTIANIQSLKYALDHGVRAALRDSENEAFLLKESGFLAKKEGYYFSIFAFENKIEKLTIKGTKYELENGALTTSFPLGVSNEILASKAEISFEGGVLLVIFSKKTL
ncbi:MAG: thiamine diphosphokinase [Clostridia bacterium]|nr:thiamine diphosphokinase [Clostridia bacterium]